MKRSTAGNITDKKTQVIVYTRTQDDTARTGELCQKYIEGINTVIPIGENDNGNMLILCTEDNVFYGYTDGCLVKYGNTIEEMLDCVIGENIMPEYID